MMQSFIIKDIGFFKWRNIDAAIANIKYSDDEVDTQMVHIVYQSITVKKSTLG